MKTKKYLLPAVIFFVIGLTGFYLSGPSPAELHLKTELPMLNSSPEKLEEELKSREQNTLFLKKDNEARIIWADSSKKEKTPFCLVYLHGFSASWKEGDPVHKNIAKKYGFNLYLPRLSEHGLKKQEPLLELDAEQYLESARLAVAEAKILGEKVIIMSTSTGGTLSLLLASENPEIEALLLYSPNIDLYDKKAFVLTQPWGLQLARRVVKSNYYTFEGNEEVQKYWNTTYRIEALITLKNLLEHTMNPETFKKVKQPVLLCYFYKNEQEQDNIVSVPAMLDMFENLGTPAAVKRKHALPEVGAHAMASGINSRDIASVEKATSQFLEEILKLKALN